MAKIKQRILSLSILLIGLGLCLPIYKKIYQASAQPSGDHIKPGFELPPEVIVEPEPELKTSAYGSYENQLELKAEQPPQNLADNAEIIFVSGYDLKDDIHTGNRIKANVKVNIDRPGKNVLLVLSNYASIVWEVEASPNTNITGILQGSYNPSAVVTTSPTQGFLVDLSSVSDLESIDFVQTVKQLNQWFGIEKIDAFAGQSDLPATISISELDPPDPSLTLTGYPIQKPVENFEFTLYDRNSNPSRWTLVGAVNSSDRNNNVRANIAVSPDGTEYELTEKGIKVTDRQTGEQQEFEPPSKFPELSHPSGIAYDSKRDLVAVVSFGGEGHFYRFDPKQRRWLDVRSASDFDIGSLTYDSVTDKYIAWATEYSDDIYEGTLLVISGSGKLLKSEYIADKMSGFSRLYDRGNEFAPHVQVKANGNDLALIAYRDDYSGEIANSPQAIWHYNLDFKTMQLTYKLDR